MNRKRGELIHSQGWLHNASYKKSTVHIENILASSPQNSSIHEVDRESCIPCLFSSIPTMEQIANQDQIIASIYLRYQTFIPVKRYLYK